jgi:hypothetical protein
MTDVFISWGGEQSKLIAEELRNWIPSVLQFAKPYFTPNDIEKGTSWNAGLSTKLAKCNVGIICLTKESLQRPWVLFEAGALSKDLERSRVCPILFGIEETDLSGPLTTFQATKFEKTDFKKMMSVINEAGGGNTLQIETFDRVFEMWWPYLEVSISKILSEKAGPKREIRADREILEEILDLTRHRRLRPQADYPSSNQIPLKLVHDFTLEIDKMVNLAELEDSGEIVDISIKLIKMFRYICRNGDRDQLQLIEDLLKRTSEVFLSAEKT